ncbi:MAG: caspase family protein [Halobacteriota archaeon]
MNGETNESVYHVLLIGIDRYPPGYNSLRGCINDIDAIEQLLFEAPGIDLPIEQIKVTRLAAPHPGQPSASRFQAQTRSPTKANFVAALKKMAGADVKQTDRVLIYYSGHGSEDRWSGSSVWREALVPHDDQAIEPLFDVEVNGLISAIAARTSDLTVVLDCCNSAGATRSLTDIQPKGAIRTIQLKATDTPAAPPDLAALGLDSSTARTEAKGLLQSSDPDYLVVVACQSNETAGEDQMYAQRPHGVFTCSLLSVLGARDATKRAQVRWADIWSDLLAKAAERNGRLSQPTQHPWTIGRTERKVFGGPWEKMDVGLRVTRRPDGDYEINAGTLMGVTENAEIAVYGREPRFFPPTGSADDQPIGRLQVKEAGPSSAVAGAVGAVFALPDGARGRLVKPGESERLQVSLKPEDATLKAYLEASPLLEIVSASAADADVEVIAQQGGGWIIGNDVEVVLATVPGGEAPALRAALEYYYRYNTVLRMARNCNDPQINNSLSVRLLDCNDQTALKAMSPKELADPVLPEAPRDDNKAYKVEPGFKSCVKVVNSSPYDLNVTLFDCSSGGKVQHLSDALLRKGAAQVLWLDNTIGVPFEHTPDEKPADAVGVTVPDYVTDRVIAIGTTRTDLDLDYLGDGMDKTMQTIVDENIAGRALKAMRPPTEKTSIAPAELWTATVVPVRIERR